MSSCWAVVPAAGIGQRMGGAEPKQYLKILGRTMLDHTLEKLLNHPSIQGVVVAIGADDEFWKHSEYANHAAVDTVVGGVERVHSVQNALQKLSELTTAETWVLVHDAARPCVLPSDITRLIDQSEDHAVGGILGAPVADTVKRVGANGLISDTVDRAHLWRAFTPQMFRLGMLQQALQSALAQGVMVTDECSAIEAAGFKPLIVQGSNTNIKITHPEDLLFAESFLA